MRCENHSDKNVFDITQHELFYSIYYLLLQLFIDELVYWTSFWKGTHLKFIN